MPDDGLALVLSRLEEQPPVRPAFAEALGERLAEELGFRRPARRTWRAPFRAAPSLRPLTLRTALVAAALLLLLVAAVTAAGLVVREWLSAGPAGPQYTDDFTLHEVFREPGGVYGDFNVAMDGRTLLATRVPVQWLGRENAEAAIVRFDPSSPGGLAPVDLLRYEQLRRPDLWDADVDLRTATLSRSIGGRPFDAVSLAPGGDMFVVASVYPAGLTQAPGASTLVVVHPDGSIDRVLTSGDLLESGLFDRLGEVIGMGAVASAPDLLWAWVDGPVADPPGSTTWLFQVVDPNADGDWSDRVIRPLVLPDSVPQVEYGVYERSYGSPVAEPSVPGRDRSRSVLLPVLERSGSYSLRRLTDTQGDGDLRDPGEVELVFEGLTSSEMAGLGSSPPISPRVVVDGGELVLDEIVIGGLSRASRVSRITPDGVVDIVRALPTWADDVAADGQGSIYVATQESGVVHGDGSSEPSTFVLYRLDPVPVGAAAASAVPAAASPPASPSASPTMTPPASPTASPPASPVPADAPWFELQPVTSGLPQVAFQAYTGSPDPRSEALTVALDGSGPSRLVDSQRVWSFCQSADGTQTAHRAEGEVPGEPFVWVAGADGSDPVIVSETANLFWCGFPPDAMLLGTGQDASSPQAVVRHDLSTGAESIVAEGVIVLGLSPDGSRLAVVDEGDRSRLDVVDVATGDRWTVAGPEEGTIRAAWWSPDGASVAYLIGETTGFDPAAEEDLALSVIDVAGGRPTELIAFHGREPEVSWSADSARLLLRGPTSHSDAFVLETPEGPLWLLERAGAEARMVLEDGVRWAGWSPVDPDTFAYATGEALFLSIPDGQATRLVDRPTEPLCELCWDEGPWQVGHWLGWSPDGRYVGLGRYSGAIAVVDTTTGELLVPLVSEEGRWIDEPRWWR